VGRFLADYDLLVTPTLPETAVEHGRLATTNPGLTLKQFFEGEGSLYQYLGLFNITGSPSVSLPLAQSQAKMPIGIQLAANFGDEATLVRIARDLEGALPWKDRIPPVHASR
jgi:amidase